MDKELNLEKDLPRTTDLGGNKFSCGLCDVTFNRKDNLRTHEKKIHSIDNTKRTLVCGLCNEKYRLLADLHEHIKDEHPDIKLVFHNKVFYSQSDFDQWKGETEHQTASFFVKRSTIVNNIKNSEVSIYRCNRSGLPMASKGKKRHSKYIGTIKTGITCPAMIKVTKETLYEATEITVLYQSTHVGHKCDVRKLPLHKDDRAMIANLLSTGISINVLLDKIQAQSSPTTRLGLTTRQDIRNIQRHFKVNRILPQDDVMAVDITVQKLMREDYNSVLVYKPFGEKLEHYPTIEKEEYLLGICTEAQINLLSLYGKDCVILNSTRDTSQYGFHLTTILVHDQNESIPVAIFFSTKITLKTYELFFDAIKSKFSDFMTEVLMTDDTNTFLNAWIKTFNNTPIHLLCSWRVLQSLNNNLKSKVKDDCIRELMRRDIKQIIHELDLTTFERHLENFLSTYKDEETFIAFFKEHYVCKVQKWAYCFRKGLKINPNIKMERWHRPLKFEEAGGIVMKKLEKSLSIILKAMTKKLMNRLISIESEFKLTDRVKLNSERHAESERMSESVYEATKMNDGCFLVSKTMDEMIVTYDVEVENTACDCSTVCEDCKICIHTLSCSCVDYNIRYVICKHIHFVCRQYNVVRDNIVSYPSSSLVEEDNLVIYVTEGEMSVNVENDIVLKQISKKPRKDLDVEKLAVKEALENIYNKVESSESFEEIKYVRDNLKTITAYIDVNKSSELKICESSKATSSYKNICCQRKFRITKRKQKK